MPTAREWFEHLWELVPKDAESDVCEFFRTQLRSRGDYVLETVEALKEEALKDTDLMEPE